MNSITINFQNATLTTSTLQILVTNGSFALDSSRALSIAGTISFTSLYVTSGAINFYVESGTSFNASVEAPLNAMGGSATIEITNFSGDVMVTWPTNEGPQIQTLMAGDPITLNGYAD